MHSMRRESSEHGRKYGALRALAWTLRERFSRARLGAALVAATVTGIVIVGCLTSESPVGTPRDATGTAVAADAVVRPVDAVGDQAADAAAPSPTTPLDRNIRVRLCGRHGCESFSLAVKSRCTVTEGSGHSVLDPNATFLTPQTVTPAPLPRGITVGARTFDVDELCIAPHDDAAIVVNGATYRGMLTIRRAGAQLLVNNVLDVEAYLPAVLAGELPASFHTEAFKALAVAARTYVLYQKQVYGGRRDFDVLPDERSQVYADWTRVPKKAVEAARSTKGEVCTLPPAEGGAIFCTYYSSCCGGQSQPIRNMRRDESASAAPLAGGVTCAGCKRAPHYRWGELRLTKAEITRRVCDRYPSLKKLGRIEKIEPSDVSPDGRMIRLRLTGSGGTVSTLGAEDFRLAVGGRQLKSTHCRMYDDGAGVVFYDGYGYGHGVGLCQYGSDTAARQGDDYRAILARYFPGCDIRPILQ